MSERHPIEVGADLPLEDRVRHLEAHLATLWDQVWWMQLDPDTRAAYEAQGFKAPIKRFYIEAD